MKTDKSFTMGLAAAAMVGAIGFAYAQTSTDPAPMQPASPTVGTTSPAQTTTARSTSTDRGSAATMTERAPQADRN